MECRVEGLGLIGVEGLGVSGLGFGNLDMGWECIMYAADF